MDAPNALVVVVWAAGFAASLSPAGLAPNRPPAAAVVVLAAGAAVVVAAVVAAG